MLHFAINYDKQAFKYQMHTRRQQKLTQISPIVILVMFCRVGAFVYMLGRAGQQTRDSNIFGCGLKYFLLSVSSFKRLEEVMSWCSSSSPSVNFQNCVYVAWACKCYVFGKHMCANLWAIIYFWQFQRGVIINRSSCAGGGQLPIILIQTSALRLRLILNMIKFANSVEVLAKTGFISMQAFQRLCKFSL